MERTAEQTRMVAACPAPGRAPFFSPASFSSLRLRAHKVSWLLPVRSFHCPLFWVHQSSSHHWTVCGGLSLVAEMFLFFSNTTFEIGHWVLLKATFFYFWKSIVENYWLILTKKVFRINWQSEKWLTIWKLQIQEIQNKCRHWTFKYIDIDISIH